LEFHWVREGIEAGQADALDWTWVFDQKVHMMEDYVVTTEDVGYRENVMEYTKTRKMP
jgi:hypothetical protein